MVRKKILASCKPSLRFHQGQCKWSKLDVISWRMGRSSEGGAERVGCEMLSQHLVVLMRAACRTQEAITMISLLCAHPSHTQRGRSCEESSKNEKRLVPKPPQGAGETQVCSFWRRGG